MDTSVLFLSIQTEPLTKSYSCELCSKQFTQQKNLTRHKLKIHNTDARLRVNDIHCPISPQRCSVMHNLSSYRTHLSQQHDIEIECTRLKFSTESDFLSWKGQIEYQTKSQFIVRSKKVAKKNNPNSWTMSYICHRSKRCRNNSQFRRDEDDGGRGGNEGSSQKQRTSSKGKAKLDFLCPCGLDLEGESNGEVTCDYYSTHYGHQLDISYLRLPQKTRDEVLKQLREGLTLQQIMSSFHEKFIGFELSREHLITTKDVYNIARKYNIKVISNANDSAKRAGTSYDDSESLRKKLHSVAVDKILFKNERFSHFLTSKNHRTSMRFSDRIYEVEGDDRRYYQVEDDAVVYTVRPRISPHEVCEKMCESCNVCIHRYTCDCSVNRIDQHICEHIHAIAAKFGAPDSTYVCAEVTEDIHAQGVVETWAQVNYSHNCQAIINNLDQVKDLLQTRRCTDLKKVADLINTAKTILEASEKTQREDTEMSVFQVDHDQEDSVVVTSDTMNVHDHDYIVIST